MNALLVQLYRQSSEYPSKGVLSTNKIGKPEKRKTKNEKDQEKLENKEKTGPTIHE
jgi:hypothetical protein